MKSESLQALLIDRHFGELSPEAEELLEAHLSTHPSARAEAGRLDGIFAATRETLLRDPELGRPVPVIERAFFGPLPGLLRAAAAIALALAFGALGFFVGRGEFPLRPATPPLATEPPCDSPWARYAISPQPGKPGVKIVRLEPAPTVIQ